MAGPGRSAMSGVLAGLTFGDRRCRCGGRCGRVGAGASTTGPAGSAVVGERSGGLGEVASGAHATAGPSRTAAPRPDMHGALLPDRVVLVAARRSVTLAG